MTSDCRIVVFDRELRLGWFNRAAGEAWTLVSDDLGTSAEDLTRGRDWPWYEHLPRALAVASASAIRTRDRIVRFEPASEPEGGLAVVDESAVGVDDAATVEAMWHRLSKMASVVAHEVKNPLAGVSGALHVLANRFAPESSDRGIVEEMQARLAALNSTLDELLLFARPVRVRSTHGSLREVVDRAVAALRTDPDVPPVDVEIEGEAPDLRLDTDLLVRAVRNLLQNAVQASPSGVPVRVQLSALEGRARIDIVDRGPGVDDDVAPRLFEPFFTRRSPGAGLGLTVARRIVEAHEGTLQLVRNPDEAGARFRIELAARD